MQHSVLRCTLQFAVSFALGGIQASRRDCHVMADPRYQADKSNLHVTMIIRTTNDLKGTKGDVRTKTWSSKRLLHREDGMGVTLTDAILEEGLDQVFWYKEHLESVYCLEGEGTLEDLATGQIYDIKQGTLYALDKHDRHRLKVGRRMRVICTFVPPLVGGEMHDVDGSYRR
jgi:L-ectoine synthase